MGYIFLNLRPKNLMVNLFLNSDERFMRDPRKPSENGNMVCGPEMKIKLKAVSSLKEGLQGWLSS